MHISWDQIQQSRYEAGRFEGTLKDKEIDETGELVESTCHVQSLRSNNENMLISSNLPLGTH